MVEEVRISVAMITYNGERFLRPQLDSILCQLGEEDEVVISDDGSSDHTLQIIREYQKKYAAIKLIHGPCRGIKRNVECALKSCRGKYIFLADQDDIWMSDKVARVLEAFQEHNASLVIHDAIVFQEDIHLPVMDSFFAFRQAKAGVVKNIVKNSYIGCCMAFSKELTEKILPIPSAIEMHDQWIGVLNDFYLEKSYFYRTPLLYYRRHQDNHSGMAHYALSRMIGNRVRFIKEFVRRMFGIDCQNRKGMLK